MDSDMDLLSGLLEVGKVASHTEINLQDSTTRVSEGPVLQEIVDEGYRKSSNDSEGPDKTSNVVAVSMGAKVNLGKKKRLQHSKKSQFSQNEMVTLTGLSVTGVSSPLPKKHKPIRICLLFVSLQALSAVYSIDVSEDSNEMRERLASLNDHLTYLHGEKSKQERELEALKKEKLSLVDKFAKLSLHTKELEEKSNRVAALESDIDALQQEISMLRAKLKERDDQILNLQSQVLA
ncbi:hypothetical protein ACLB2K_073035 [Fragaria x ananassa]